MELTSTVRYAARGLQLVFSMAAMGLAITALHTWTNAIGEICGPDGADGGGCDTARHDLDPVIVMLRFSAFAAAFAILDVAVCLIATIADLVPWMVVWVCDALAGMSLLAAGLAIAVLMKRDACQVSYSDDIEWRRTCTNMRADMAFSFLSLIALLASAGVGILKGWPSRSAGAPAGQSVEI